MYMHIIDIRKITTTKMWFGFNKSLLSIKVLPVKYWKSLKKHFTGSWLLG